MNGGYVHEHILDALEQEFRKTGAEVARQVPSRPGRRTGYVDLVVRRGDNLLAVEAETSCRRIVEDMQKAEELGARLWIVVANRRLADSVKRHLKTLWSWKTTDVCVLTLGQALARITN